MIGEEFELGDSGDQLAPFSFAKARISHPRDRKQKSNIEGIWTTPLGGPLDRSGLRAAEARQIGWVVTQASPIPS
jgi:hypothetical protein